MNYAVFYKNNKFINQENINDYEISSREDFNLIIPDYFSDKNKFNHLRVKAIYEEGFFKDLEFYMNGLKIKKEKNKSEIEIEFENHKHLLKITDEPANLSVLVLRFEYFIYRREKIYAKNEFFITVNIKYQGRDDSKAVNEIINIILENDYERAIFDSKLFIEILSNGDLNNLFNRLIDKKYNKDELKLLSYKYANQLDIDTQQKLSRYLFDNSYENNNKEIPESQIELAIKILKNTDRINPTKLMVELGISNDRAVKIIEVLEERGIVSKANPISGNREFLS
jgi:predicted transcriptional regulator